MTMQFFASNRNVGLPDYDTGNGNFLSLSAPSLGLNHVNETSQISSHLVASNPPIQELRSQPTTILGQLGLSHRITETRTTIFSQNRVQIHSVIDYAPLETPAAALTLTNVNGAAITGAELVRTQVLTAVSARERLIIPNNCLSFQSQPVSSVNNIINFQNRLLYDANNGFQNLPSANATNRLRFPNPTVSSGMDPNLVNQFRNPYSGTDVHRNMHYQTPFANQPVLDLNCIDSFKIIGNGVIACPPISVHFPEPDDGVNSDNQVHLNLSHFNPAESNGEHVPTHIPVNQSLSVQDSDEEVEDDLVIYGTKSFPYKKYGPYTCPRCTGKFPTSQSFAAHMGSHYRTETIAERKKRQAMKYKKKNLHLVQSRDGLTVLPDSFGGQGKGKRIAIARAMGRGRARGRGKAKEKGIVIGKKAAKRGGSVGTAKHAIKQEPM